MRCGRRMPVEGERAVGREPPGPRRLLRAVGRPRPPLDERPVRPQLERLAPARAGEGVAGRPEHHLGRGVLLVGVDPPLTKEPGGNLWLRHRRRDPRYFRSDFRSPSRAACMRSVWPSVNMNIASSST
jgi:hypothetical protein